MFKQQAGFSNRKHLAIRYSKSIVNDRISIRQGAAGGKAEAEQHGKALYENHCGAHHTGF